MRDPLLRPHTATSWLVKLTVLLTLSSLGCLTTGANDDDDDDDPFIFTPAPQNPNAPNDPASSEVKLQQVGHFMVDGKFLTYMAHILGKPFGAPDQPRDEFHLTNFILKNQGAQPAEVVAKLSLDGYSEPVRQIITLSPGEERLIGLTPTLNYERLYAISAGASANITLELTKRDGSLLELSSTPINIRPVNHVTWAYRDESGDVIDLKPFIAALVTPEDRGNEVQRLLGDAARDFPEVTFIKSDDEDALLMIAYALYMTLQKRQIVYSSVTGSFFMEAQNVKLPGQSLRTGSANCIDGALVFASAFEALGLNPAIVMVTGHAFVALNLPDGRRLPIETTMVASHSFQDAVASGVKQLAEAEANDPNFMYLNILTARYIGIPPINL